ncbi:MAG: DEAD/DEAH box helicase [bacterium]
MEIDFLRHYGFTPPLIDTLRQAYGEILLPLQERVILEGRMFEGKSLLVRAPTSAGKTFLAETLFLFHALRGGNVILLVPTKALANQRHQQLQERYAPHGFDIRLSTRDHPFDDQKILEGRFHLAIVIYEKMRSLLALRDAFLSSLAACVVDEIHYLFDPTRGPDLEILLSRLREESALPILGLSAMVSSKEVADWLDARPLVETRRPVELRQGVLCQGRFVYKEFNSGREGHEKLFESDTADEGEAMLEAACHFAAQGETTLVFWPRRGQCYTAARKLAERFDPPEKPGSPNLDGLESTAMRDFLARLLPRRVAVHTSDLSPAERDLVECLARSGEVLLICATSTLAEGINFPVVNVLTTRRMYSQRPEDAGAVRPPATLPIPQGRLWNMIGRAGRLGLSPFGRGILVTTSPGDVQGLMRLYLNEESPQPLPLLHRAPFAQTVLKTMAGRAPFTRESCRQALERTLSERMGLFPRSLAEQVAQTLRDLIHQGFLVEERETFHPTPLGCLVMNHGLSSTSAYRLDDYVVHRLHDQPLILEILLLISELEEMAEQYVFVPRHDILTHAWTRRLMQRVEETGASETTFLDGLLTNPARIRPEHHAAFKKTMLLHDWIQGRPILEIENRYNVYAGAAQRLAEEASWLTGCLAETAGAHALRADWIKQLLILKDRILHGLPEAALGWFPFLQERRLTRGSVLALVERGYGSPEQISGADPETVQDLLPAHFLESSHRSKTGLTKEDSAPPPADHEPLEQVVELDDGRPNRMVVNGAAVPLTLTQFRLVRCLARRAGACVDYETILREVWPESVGDRKQISRQKKWILGRIQDITHSPAEDLIETIPGAGLLLHARVKCL